MALWRLSRKEAAEGTSRFYSLRLFHPPDLSQGLPLSLATLHLTSSKEAAHAIFLPRMILPHVLFFLHVHHPVFFPSSSVRCWFTHFYWILPFFAFLLAIFRISSFICFNGSLGNLSHPPPHREHWLANFHPPSSHIIPIHIPSTNKHCTSRSIRTRTCTVIQRIEVNPNLNLNLEIALARISTTRPCQRHCIIGVREQVEQVSGMTE